MLAPAVTIIDYGMGNLWSVRSAFEYLGCEVCVSDNPSRIRQAQALVLPGVGSFRAAMERLCLHGLDDAIRDAARIKRTRILGICLGMQLMAAYGTEDGDTIGLGLIPATVRRFQARDIGTLKIPHVGFNKVLCPPKSLLFQGLGLGADFYFVHSFRIKEASLPGRQATCCYGEDFLAAYEEENIFATQFHPEKSQTNGLILLQNFLAD